MFGATVAEQEKKPASKEPVDNERFSATIKLRPEFKESLVMVAKSLGMVPGEFVEERLGQLVRSEWKKLLTEKLKKAKD